MGAIVTRLDGEPLTPISNSCAFCDLILGTSQGYRRCVGSWRSLAGQREQKPRLRQCHAGLLHARGRIEVEDEFVAMTFAGQIVVDGGMEQIAAGVDELATACEIDPAQLRETLPLRASAHHRAGGSTDESPGAIGGNPLRRRTGAAGAVAQAAPHRRCHRHLNLILSRYIPINFNINLLTLINRCDIMGSVSSASVSTCSSFANRGGWAYGTRD